jgi:transmembrane sensor
MECKQDDVMEQAARWLVRSSDASFSRADKRRRDAWLGEAPAHRAAYEEIQNIWRRAGAVAYPQAVGTGIGDRRETRRRRPNRFRPETMRCFGFSGKNLGGAVAAMVLLFFIGSFFIKAPSPPTPATTYATAIGEQRQVTLGDGSVIRINVDTAISVRLTDEKRQVDMTDGEVFFEVAPNLYRPFEVETPAGRIRVLGTAFNVKSRDGRLSVDVGHGRVQVWSNSGSGGSYRGQDLILTAGQGVDISPSGALGQLRASRIEQATAWLDRRVYFRNAPVRRVLDELERYHQVNIGLGDDGIGEKGITGAFDMDALARTLDLIAMAASLDVRREADGTLTLHERAVSSEQ